MVRSLLLASAALSGALIACVSTPDLTTVNDPPGPNTDDAGAADGGVTNLDSAVPPPDASAIAACAAACPQVGGTCDGATCVIACPGPPACTTALTCPTGVACKVLCPSEKSCASVDCGSASTCRVECTGKDACRSVRSNAGQTELVCSGKDACKDIGCAGDACVVQCMADGCKANEVKCCAKQCTVNGAPGKCM